MGGGWQWDKGLEEFSESCVNRHRTDNVLRMSGFVHRHNKDNSCVHCSSENVLYIRYMGRVRVCLCVHFTPSNGSDEPLSKIDSHAPLINI